MRLRNNVEDQRTLNALTRTNLEFPLARHHFCVDTRDLDTSKQTSFVVSLDNISAVYLAGTHTTVVWSLRGWETSFGPAIGPVVKTKKSVFLL